MKPFQLWLFGSHDYHSLPLTSGEQFARWCLYIFKCSARFSCYNLYCWATAFSDIAFLHCLFSLPPTFIYLSSLLFFKKLLFWRGTNPFATVKLKPTATDDRSSPRFHRQWHLNPEMNAFIECDSSSLTLKIVVWLIKWTFGGGCFVFYCPLAHKYGERRQNFW